MYDSEIFVFGSKIFEDPSRDAISLLPFELSWKIFLYLDDASLRYASRANKIWSRIIVSHKKLRGRLNHFELSLKLGSKRLARFYKTNKKIMKKMPKKNYLPIAEDRVESTINTGRKAKRSGEVIVIHTKRLRVF